ncbi:hypothetical protein N7495_007618 [Penicillium taxi]|uniref:uncharacterized protein n=1 Tax=Penicillium taxi TaxID=168475 RepID=UPI00254528FA|nr:uncharacterized protein N7495_007618 [Penicillium taxi]KAJ5887577.1 hypothetical protein N7495_007618 [Penicillium taxi]
MTSKVVNHHHNVLSSKYYAIAIGAIMVIFIACHWMRKAYITYGPRKSRPSVQILVRYSRATCRLLSSAPFGINLDRCLLYLLYWAINLIITFTNLQYNAKQVAKRFGWVCLTNLVLLVFLALKNTPLAPLSGRSYEKLRPLHKVAGYTCIFSSVLHGVTYLGAYAAAGTITVNMKKSADYAGGIAGVAMLIIGFSTIGWFARRFYELFYIIHILMWILIMVTVGLHRPEFAQDAVIIVIFISALWFADRFLRSAKMCWKFFGNYATLTPMPDGAVRIHVRRGIRITPGSHAYLWIPSIRLFETHPFTAISTDSNEFLVRKYDGFTNDLFKAAQNNPGGRVRCSLDGGYGHTPNFMNFDKIVLVAGGSGATFTFSIALNVLKEAAAKDVTKNIDFIWSVRKHESLLWFEQELRELDENPHVNLFIHVSQYDTPSKSSSNIDSTSSVEESIIQDFEKGSEKIDSSIIVSGLRPGRPDIFSLVTQSISGCPLEARIGIGACGPIAMIKTTREAVTQKGFDDGPSITLHTEEFEW